MVDAIASEAERAYMREAIALARRAAGRVSPNPMVGCVLVKDGAVVGRGWHEGPGRAHAEVAAIADAGARAARGATAYVTLEPCNHFGRTGPCTEALMAAGVAEVVYAVADPNPPAAGGAARLAGAGLRVRQGVCGTEVRDLVRAWTKGLAERRPYVTAKTAMSLDGRIATRTGESRWITGPEAREEGHRLRMEADAIVVGADTVIADDPALTARLDGREQFPLRVVLDSRGRTPPGARVYERSGRGALLMTTDAAPVDRIRRHQSLGVEVIMAPAGLTGRTDLDALLAILYARDVRHVLVEGGGSVVGAFFDAGLLDEIHVFMAPVILGGGRPAFGGGGVERLAEAWTVDAPRRVGRDLWFRARRPEGRL